MPVAIRDANPGDAKIIVAYNTAMALETEGRQLDASLIAAGACSRRCTDMSKHLPGKTLGAVAFACMLNTRISVHSKPISRSACLNPAMT